MLLSTCLHVSSHPTHEHVLALCNMTVGLGQCPFLCVTVLSLSGKISVKMTRGTSLFIRRLNAFLLYRRLHKVSASPYELSTSRVLVLIRVGLRM